MRLKTVLFSFFENFITFWYNYLLCLGVIGISSLFFIHLKSNTLAFSLALTYTTLLLSAQFVPFKGGHKYLLTLASFLLLMGVIYTTPTALALYSKFIPLILLTYVFMFPDSITPIFVGLILLLKVYTFKNKVPMDALIGNSRGVITQLFAYEIITVLIRRIVKEKNKYKKISNNDSLTGISTLAYIINIGNKLIRQGYDVSVLIIDLNNFKQFNEIYGFIKGNSVLIKIAEYLKHAAIKHKGIPGRLGGDEFILLLRNYPEKNFKQLIEVLQEEITKTLIDADPGAEPVDLSFSIGKASSIYLSRPYNMEKLLYNADMDMYYNKFGKKKSLTKFKTHYEFFPENIKQILNVMAEKDMFIYVQSEYSAQYAACLAKQMDLSEEEIVEVYKAGWLHDIGKILISKNILIKTEKLTHGEQETMKKHVLYGKNFIKSLTVSDTIINGMLYHHEHWNGNGYPFKLKGKDIPLIGRILKITDAFSMMIMKYAYAPLISKQEALNELNKHAGKEFDPELLTLFETVIEEEKEDFIVDSINKWINIKKLSTKTDKESIIQD